ncbi:MAG: BON domain-containing protein [Chloroflexi bacterium]|nr:BON domain-containing protein [Chloroflexota bacterium]
MKADIQLHQDVLAAIAAEPRLASANIGIAVKNGIITLSGFCESHAQKVVAEKICARLTGVRGIAEEIQVNPPIAHRRTDEEIAGAALNVLSWNTMVPANAISVKVEHGWITISGDVVWQYEKREAEKAIRYVQGMRGISNKITVTPKAQIGDVQSAITQAFQRTASQDAHRIAVTTDGNVVTISGYVSSWAEYKEAERAALAVPGVAEVRNELKVNLLGPEAIHIA